MATDPWMYHMSFVQRGSLLGPISCLSGIVDSLENEKPESYQACCTTLILQYWEECRISEVMDICPSW